MAAAQEHYSSFAATDVCCTSRRLVGSVFACRANDQFDPGNFRTKPPPLYPEPSVIVKQRARGFPSRVQCDTSGCAKPPIDFKTQVPFWPGLAPVVVMNNGSEY